MSQLKKTAMRLMKEGLIDRYDPASWHSHAFRASFKTTAEHVGIDSSIVEFWMGHDQGIEAVYNYRDQVHESDFEEAYRRLEPHISLDYTEIAVREEYESTNKQMM